MIKRIKNIIARDDFIKNNIIFFIGSILVAILNYLYHPILSRMMSVEDFGEVQALIALFLQFSIIFGIFRMIVVNITANHGNNIKKEKIISQVYKLAIIIAGLISLLIIILNKQLEDFFSFQSSYSFFSLAIILIISIPFIFRRAYFQGINKFKELSIANIILAGSRLLVAIVFVYLGLATFGAISAIGIATLFALWYSYAKTKNEFKLSIREKIKFDKNLLEELKFGVLVLCATGFVVFLYTADVLIVKHYFSANEAGFYSGISTVARIIFFATGSISGVLIASIKLRNSAKDNNKVMLKALALVATAGLILVGMFSYFPNMVIQIFIGKEYIDYSFLLPKLAVVLFLVSVINLFVSYFLALRKYFLITITIIGVLIISLLSIFSHATLMSVINNFLYSSIVIAILLVVIFLRYSQKQGVEKG